MTFYEHSIALTLPLSPMLLLGKAPKGTELMTTQKQASKKNVSQCLRDIVRLNPAEGVFRLKDDGRQWTHAAHQRDRLLLQLASYANPDGTKARPALPTLMATMRWSRRKVYRTLAALKTLGFVRDAGVHEETGVKLYTIDLSNIIKAVSSSAQDDTFLEGSAVPSSQVAVPSSHSPVSSSQVAVPSSTVAVPSSAQDAIRPSSMTINRPSKQPSIDHPGENRKNDGSVSSSPNPALHAVPAGAPPGSYRGIDGKLYVREEL
jgi:hypothetical protein